MDNLKAFKICPDCKKSIDKKARICPFCRKKFGLTKPAKYFLLFLGFIFLIYLLSPIVNHKKIPNGKNKENQAEQRYATSIGEIGLLESGAQIVPVAATKEAFEAWTKARVAKDEYGMGLLLASELIFTPQIRTRALIIDTGMFTRKVRILEGKYQGRSGWIPYEYIIKEGT